MYDFFKTLFAKLGVTIPADKEKDFSEAAAAYEKKLADEAKAKENAVPKKDDEVPAWAKSIMEQNKTLSEALKQEREARETSVKSLQESAKSQRAKEVKDLVDGAVKKGQITPKDAEKWTKRLTDSFEASKEILAEIPPNPALVKEQGKEADKGGKGTSSITPEGKVIDINQLREGAAEAFRANAAT